MNNRIIAGITLTAFLSLGFPVAALPSTDGVSAQQAAGHATVEAQAGDVGLKGSKASLPGHLEVGSTVSTGENGEVILRLTNGSRVRLGKNSELTVIRSNKDGAEVSLQSGRLFGSTNGALVVKTRSSEMTATQGEFALEADSDGAGLRVLSGDARLESLASKFSSNAGLDSVEPTGNPFLAVLGLDHLQTSGLFAFGGTGKGKGVRVRSTDNTPDEQVGGISDASPDQDILAPGPKPEPPIAVDPVPPTTPPTGPPTTTPTTPPVEAAVVAPGGGFGALGIIAAVGALTGLGFIIADRDSDTDGGTFEVPTPSPSLP